MPYCFSKSSVKFQGHTGQRNHQFWLELSVSGLQLQFEFTDGFEMMHKAWCSKEEVCCCVPRSSIKFQGHTAKKSSILTYIGHFSTVTPVWIHQWLWNDAQSLKLHMKGALLFVKVIRQTSRSRGTKKSLILTRIERFWTVTPSWIHPWLSNDAQT